MAASKKDIESIHYLSPLQQGLLFHAVAERSSDPYFAQAEFQIEGSVEPQAFERAWQLISERHPILRTAFVWEGVAKPVQVVRKSARVTVSHHDLRGCDAVERQQALDRLMAAERAAGFDLLKAPLMRLMLVRTGEQAFTFVNSHHHLLLDGWSLALLLQEAFVAYAAFTSGVEPQLPAVRPYGDYLAWVQHQDEAAAEAFFRDTLRGFEQPTPLPLASTCTGGAQSSELPFAERELRLSETETAALLAYARGQRLTLNTVLQGAWAVLLSRHSGEREVVFGATVSGRPATLDGSDSMVGLLINTLPVRASVLEHETVSKWLQRVQDRSSQLGQYEWAPLAQVQRWSEVPQGTPLFESIVVFESYPEQDVDDGALALQVRPLPRRGPREEDALLSVGRNNYPLSLMVEPTRELGLIVCYERRRFSHESAAQLLTQLRTLLGSIVARPSARVAELSLVTPEERRRLLAQHNADGASYKEATVHGLIEAAAVRRPEVAAVVSDTGTFTYRILDERANQLARRLHALGVRLEDRVVLCLERSADLIVALLASLKVGAAYVPLDPRFPAARLQALSQDSGAKVAITLAAWSGTFEALPTVCLDRDHEELRREATTSLAIHVPPAAAAYVIYTSGSTGQPKGVAVEHRNLVNYVRGVLSRLALPDDAGLALVSTVAADLGHTSLFGALCSGRTLHVLSEARVFDPDRMAEVISERAIDALKIVPSHLAALLAAAEPERVLPKRCLVLGGEAATPDLLAQIARLAPECVVVNHYGPTETTVGALTWPISSDARGDAPVPIGLPLSNIQAHVLDRAFEPVPVGVSGELYIGGAGVARGYQGQPALTAERFVPDPFAALPGARLYRTGDRARRRQDGAIEFLGRADHQVKIRGYRVELGEVEAHLRALPDVKDAVVVALDDGRGGKKLVGYIVARAEPAPQPIALLAALSQRLPDPMLPSEVVTLSAMPLTRNGKIDRAALPAPGQATEARDHVAPRNATEALLCEVWGEVLRREQVGVEDDFFALGGDSILSLQIIAKANQRGLRIMPKQLFAHRTIAGLVAALPDAAAAPRPSAPPVARRPFELARLAREDLEKLRALHADALEDVYPASPVQQGMLFHALLSPETNPYFNQIVCRFERGLDVAALTEAGRLLGARHAILRTAFAWDGAVESLANAHQVILREAPLPLEQHDLRELRPEQQRATLEHLLETDRARGFRFEQAPLMRLSVLRLADDVFEVVWSTHHALLDGWCQAILVGEWLELYRQLHAHLPLEQSPPPAPYRDYVAWLAEQDSAAAERFFRAQLRGLAEPTRLPEPSARSESRIIEHSLRVSAGVTRSLEQLAREQGVTLNTVVQAAWALLLSRQGATGDVLFGITVAGRPAELPEAGMIMGAFINSLPLRVNVRPDCAVSKFMQDLQSLNLELRQYEHAPLVQVQGFSDVPRGTPLFDSLLVFQNYPVDEVLDERRRALGIEVSAQQAWTNYPLTVYARPGAELSFVFAFNTAQVDDEAVRCMAAALISLLAELPGAAHRPLGALTLQDERERERLALWNATAQAWPSASLPELFTAQARCTPGALALKCGGHELTYAQLDARANQLARHLRRQGVGPEVLVGVCLQRSVEMVVALLGVLKAGGAYVPLDPSYPQDRLNAMIEDARLGGMITQQTLARDAALLDAEEQTALDAGVGPDNLAYVIYTSGSTGRPKGVMVPHRGLSNFLHSIHHELGVGPDSVVLATTSISFDIAVLELFLPLTTGGQVIIAQREDVVDGERLAALLAEARATLLQATPTAWKMLLASGADLSGVTALCGGEALTCDLAAAFVQAKVSPINLYGPTETTVWSSIARVSSAEAISLGGPLANTQLYVLDQQLHRLPQGFVGELSIGGAGLARGYLGRPALTAERFVPDPFAAAPGSLMYRTGDRVRVRVDGSLEFLGRADHQLKIRGFRVEAGDIEAALRAVPNVRDAIVVARQEPAGPRLVAYVVSANPAPSPDELRASLRQRLPDYMVPSDFMLLSELPLTPNGKIDRKALPAAERTQRAPLSRPRTATEERVSAIWAETLKLTSVGTDESFFELGGESLLATRVIARIRASFEIELPLRAIFDRPTVAALAVAVDEAVRARRGIALAPIRKQPRLGRLPLSFAQQRLWLLDQVLGTGANLTIPFALRLDGALEAQALGRAFEVLLARHEPLRTRFELNPHSAEPEQIIEPGYDFALPVLDLGGEPAEHVEAQIAAIHGAALDLRTGPLVRASLLRLGPDAHLLCAVVHHIAVDGWSIALLVDELMNAYRSILSGAQLPAAPELAYADYAVWQREQLTGKLWEEQLSYWRSALAGASAELGLPRLAAEPAGPARVGRIRARLPADAVEALQRRAERHDATLFIVLYAALNVALHHQTGRDDLLIGTDIAGREQPETEQMIGFFVNQLVLRCRLAGLQQVSELVAEARRVVLDGAEHQELPFDAIVAELRPERSVHEMPLFHAKLILQNIATPHFELPGLTVSELERGPHGVEVDLLVNASSGPDGLELLLDYRADRYSEATMNEVLALTSKALELFGRVDVEALATLSELLNEEQRSLNASAAASTRALQDQGRSTLGQARRKPVPLAAQHSDEVTGQ